VLFAPLLSAQLGKVNLTDEQRAVAIPMRILRYRYRGAQICTP
jgi:hypothetical protein